jgi:DNA-directed RNA polymerase subunit RPC12/RpoP
MKHTGDRPGKGTYICMTCGKKIVIEKDEKKLPVCPQCKGSMFR